MNDVFAQPAALQGMKDLKVRLPIRYHVQLQSLKVLTGKNISLVVEEALAMYFRDEARAPTAELAVA